MKRGSSSTPDEWRDLHGVVSKVIVSKKGNLLRPQLENYVSPYSSKIETAGQKEKRRLKVKSIFTKSPKATPATAPKSKDEFPPLTRKEKKTVRPWASKWKDITDYVYGRKTLEDLNINTVNTAPTKQNVSVKEIGISAPCCDNTRRRVRIRNWMYVDDQCEDSDREKEVEPKVLEPQISENVMFNVGGITFKTKRATINRKSKNRLYNTVKNNPYQELFYFDRNPDLFNFILDYFRCDNLHFPLNICRDRIEEEFNYWQIALHSGCGRCFADIFVKAEEIEFSSRNLENDFLWNADMKFSTENRAQSGFAVFEFLDDPSSSKPAFAYGFFILACVCLSLVTFVCRTIKDTLIPSPGDHKEMIAKVAQDDPRLLTNTKTQTMITHEFSNTLTGIELFTTVIFIFDIILRVVLCPKRQMFLKSAINQLEIFCTVPLAVLLTVRVAFNDFIRSNIQMAIFYAILDALKLVRICRVLKFSNKYSGLRVIVIAVRRSLRELGLLILMLGCSMVLFSTMVYYGEIWVTDSDFKDIPTGFWWAIITMTGVGYGDMYPKSIGGYTAGILCSIAGIVFLALLVPVLGNNFQVYYTYARERTIQLGAAQERESKRNEKSKNGTKSTKPNSTVTNKWDFFNCLQRSNGDETPLPSPGLEQNGTEETNRQELEEKEKEAALPNGTTVKVEIEPN